MISLDDILGQSGAVEFLRSAFAADRLPHAMVFAGPRGVGKGTCALALAGWLLCQKPKSDRACGKCDSCRLLPTGNHPDYHVVAKELIRYHDKTGKSKATLLAIEVVREELVAPAGRTAVMGRGKVFVVEQAELMSIAAQNALLKTLEEPAGRAVIVLLTDSPQSLLPTVISRCQIVRFGSLDLKLVQSELEKRGVARNRAAEAAELSDGSLGQALDLIRQEIIPAAGKLHEQIDRQTHADLPGWMKSAADAYAEKELERDPLGSKEAAIRAGLALYLMLAARRFGVRLRQSDDARELEAACSAIEATARCQMYLDANVNVPVALGQWAAALNYCAAR